jgi:two-component system, cell cycle response regulator
MERLGRPRAGSLVSAAVVALGAATVAGATYGAVRSWPLAVLAGGLPGALTAAVALALARASRGVPPAARATPADGPTALAGPERLQDDLAGALRDSASVNLHLFALEGFKAYNDAFGDACGDALLAWLARKFRTAVGAGGRAYRARGAAFAVLAPTPRTPGRPAPPAPPEPRVSRADLIGRCAAALHEVGEGFRISCVAGTAAIPEEALTAHDGLELAAARAQAERGMRHMKSGLRAAAEPQDVLRVASRGLEVAVLARRIGERLSIPGEDLDDLEAAVHLRDIGNIAIPSPVFTHAGALPAQEWRFILLHTLVGERLLRASFGMDAVATLVRHSHERFDGAGYPDSLAGEQIPLGARIVFVCGSYADMTSERPHRAARSAGNALTEIERGSGTQFDPVVAKLFVEQAEAASATPEPRPGPRPGRRSLP